MNKKGMVGKKILYIIVISLVALVINFTWDRVSTQSFEIGRLNAAIGCIPFVDVIAGCGLISIVNLILIVAALGVVLMDF